MAEQSIEFRYDTQLLIEGCEMDEDDLREYIINNFVGDSYAGGGDEDLMKVHYHKILKEQFHRMVKILYHKSVKVY